MKFRRIFLVGAGSILASILTTGTAFAAAQSVTSPVKLSGQQTVTLFDLTSGICDGCVPDILFDDPNVSGENFGVQAGVKATATMKWDADNTVETTYDDSLVKQGSILNTSDKFTEGAGAINASMTLSAFLLLTAGFVRHNASLWAAVRAYSQVDDSTLKPVVRWTGEMVAHATPFRYGPDPMAGRAESHVAPESRRQYCAHHD